MTMKHTKQSIISKDGVLFPLFSLPRVLRYGDSQTTLPIRW